MTIPANASGAPRRVVVLCYPGAELLDIAGPSNVLSAATRLATGRRGYHVELAAERAGLVATAGGIELHAKLAVSSLRVVRDSSLARGGPARIDTLIVPGGIDVEAGLGLVPHVRRLASGARRVVAVCAGSLLLAEAGLLDNRRAASHWAACSVLQQRYPSVSVEADAIFVRDGKIWTSAGVTAGMDLALALVEEDLGAPIALDVARWLVMYLRRPGGQSQFSAPLAAQRSEHAPIRELATWVQANLRTELTVDKLARRAGMSARNFARVFVAETGTTPAAWVARLRLEAARSLLELTTKSVKQVAGSCGFHSSERLHRAFQRSLQTTPLAYRARFAVVR